MSGSPPATAAAPTTALRLHEQQHTHKGVGEGSWDTHPACVVAWGARWEREAAPAGACGDGWVRD
eukprot:gene27300-53474_t